MSETIIDAISRPDVIKASRSRRRLRIGWLKGIILLLAAFWIVSEGLSVTVRYTPLQKILATRLEAVFGRPVEVGSYDFSLWGGPTLSARSVTVGEDPQFGREYFLRAESVSVRLRWQSLLRGRMEAGTVSLDRPSLNIVLAPDGRWNVAEWLPRAAESAPQNGLIASPAAPPALRFRRLEVQEGRLNFKRAYEKLPFAFVGVTGAVEANRPGRWTINLQGTPWRAAAMTQQAGVLHLSGEVGGTSSRLRPAALNVEWQGASVSDVLRLVRGDDHGIRGFFSLAVNARTEVQDGRWSVQGRAALRQIHGWDIPLRPDNPSLNLAGTLDWDPASPVVQFTNLALDAPNSRARASGRILWNRSGEKSPDRLQQPDEIALSSARVDMGDVLAWIRAFHTGITDSLLVHGSAQVQAKFVGWPLHIANAEAETDAIEVGVTGFPRTARLDPVAFKFVRGKTATFAANLAWGPSHNPGGVFRLEASFRPTPVSLAAWRITGRTAETRDLLAGAGVLGWNISNDWDLAGPFACDLRWSDIPYQSLRRLSSSIGTAAFQPVGWIEIGGSGKTSEDAKLRVPFLNQPIGQISARAELKPSSTRVSVSSAQAFGAQWSGTFNRREPSGEWQFFLSADRLATADLDRWLNPAWKESFLDRMLPFLSTRSATVAPENLRAAGRIAVGELVLPPLHISHVQGNLQLDGRQIALSDASGQFYGGRLGGSFDAILSAAPVYRTSFDFSDVSLSSLASASPKLEKLLSGSASGQIWLEAHGASRAGLIGSLTCQGRARLFNAELRKFDISMPLGNSDENETTTLFPDGSATFSCAQGKVEFQKLDLLSGAGGWIQGMGSVDFTRNIDFRLRALSTLPDNPDQQLAAFHLGGSLAAPEVSPVPAAAVHRSRQR